MAGTEHALTLYLGEKPIANLFLKSHTLHWEYTEQWLHEGYPLSPHLPLQDEIPTQNIECFLKNLLPEGDGLVELRQFFHLSQYNIYGLIRALGLDIPGALVVLGSQEVLPNDRIFRPITEDEIENRLAQKEKLSLIIWDGKPRLSSAGVQEKINILINEQNQMGFGEGNLCSTHILKFEKYQESHLVLNEWFTMQLAKNCGLSVAEVQLVRFGQYSALLVKRFDRKFISSSKILRRHTIDGCQALNLPPAYKYERNFGSSRDVANIREGASYPKLFQFAKCCMNPSTAMLQILDWALFNLLIYNHDAHGKNISFFVGKDGIKPAPFYDLVNIKMYPDFDQDMAMAFGDEFDCEQIHAYQLVEFSESCHINKLLVARRLKELATRLLEALHNVETPVPTTEAEKSFIRMYQAHILKRCQYMLEQAEIMSTIKI